MRLNCSPKSHYRHKSHASPTRKNNSTDNLDQIHQNLLEIPTQTHNQKSQQQKGQTDGKLCEIQEVESKKEIKIQESLHANIKEKQELDKQQKYSEKRNSDTLIMNAEPEYNINSTSNFSNLFYSPDIIILNEETKTSIIVDGSPPFQRYQSPGFIQDISPPLERQDSPQMHQTPQRIMDDFSRDIPGLSPPFIIGVTTNCKANQECHKGTEQSYIQHQVHLYDGTPSKSSNAWEFDQIINCEKDKNLDFEKVQQQKEKESKSSSKKKYECTETQIQKIENELAMEVTLPDRSELGANKYSQITKNSLDHTPSPEKRIVGFSILKTPKKDHNLCNNVGSFSNEVSNVKQFGSKSPPKSNKSKCLENTNKETRPQNLRTQSFKKTNNNNISTIVKKLERTSYLQQFTKKKQENTVKSCIEKKPNENSINHKKGKITNRPKSKISKKEEDSIENKSNKNSIRNTWCNLVNISKSKISKKEEDSIENKSIKNSIGNTRYKLVNKPYKKQQLKSIIPKIDTNLVYINKFISKSQSAREKRNITFQNPKNEQDSLETPNQKSMQHLVQTNIPKELLKIHKVRETHTISPSKCRLESINTDEIKTPANIETPLASRFQNHFDETRTLTNFETPVARRAYSIANNDEIKTPGHFETPGLDSYTPTGLDNKVYELYEKFMKKNLETPQNINSNSSHNESKCRRDPQISNNRSASYNSKKYHISPQYRSQKQQQSNEE